MIRDQLRRAAPTMQSAYFDLLRGQGLEHRVAARYL